MKRLALFILLPLLTLAPSANAAVPLLGDTAEWKDLDAYVAKMKSWQQRKATGAEKLDFRNKVREKSDAVWFLLHARHAQRNQEDGWRLAAEKQAEVDLENADHVAILVEIEQFYKEDVAFENADHVAILAEIEQFYKEDVAFEREDYRLVVSDIKKFYRQERKSFRKKLQKVKKAGAGRRLNKLKAQITDTKGRQQREINQAKRVHEENLQFLAEDKELQIQDQHAFHAESLQLLQADRDAAIQEQNTFHAENLAFIEQDFALYWQDEVSINNQQFADELARLENKKKEGMSYIDKMP